MPGGGHGRRIMNFFGVFPPWDERNRDAGSFLPYSIVLSAFGYATLLGWPSPNSFGWRGTDLAWLPPQCHPSAMCYWGANTLKAHSSGEMYTHFRFFRGLDENGSFEDMAQHFSNFWVTVFIWYDLSRSSSSFTPIFLLFWEMMLLMVRDSG